MNLEEILLDDPARAKLGIYRHMLEIDGGEYPIHYFEKKTGYSHIKTASLLNSMKADMEQIDDQITVLTPREKVWVSKDLPTYQTYQQYLLANSVPYLALLQTLLEPKEDLKYFGKQVELSQSSLMRRLKPLVDYLRTKGIRLNCLQMEVTGREANIRIMYFNFLWMVNFGTELYDYFKNERGLELDALLTQEELDYLRFVEKREFSLYRGLAFLRTSIGHYIDEPEMNRTLLFPNNVGKAFKAELGKIGVAETYQEREDHFVSYMVFYWAQIFSESDPRLTLIKKNYRNLPKILADSQAFFDKILPELQELSKTQQDLLLINTQNIFYRNQLFGNTAPQNLDFIIESLEKQHACYRDLHDLVAKSLPEDKDNENLVILLTLMILPDFERRAKIENVRVGIYGFPNHFLLYSMIHRIDELPFVDYELVDTHHEQHFDTVITCSKKLVPEHVGKFWVVESEGSFDAMDDYLFQLFKQKAADGKGQLKK